MIVAAGTPPAITRLTGSTDKVLGTAPKLHCNIAPVVTWIGIREPPRSKHEDYSAPRASRQANR